MAPISSSSQGDQSKKGDDSRQRDHCEALGYSRGSCGTKIRVVADGFGRSVTFTLAPGQVHEPLWVVSGKRDASNAFRKHACYYGNTTSDPPNREEMPLSPLRNELITTAIWWKTVEPVLRNDGPLQRDTTRPPLHSSLSLTSPQPQIGSRYRINETIVLSGGL